VTTLASLNSQDFFQDPKKGPTLSSGQKPSLSSLEEPDFNLSFNIPQPSLQKDNFASLGRSSDTFIQKPPLKEFSHFPSINREEPTIIPFHKPHSTPPLSSEDNSFLKKNPSFSSSSTVLTKKQIIEQLHHALHQNSFDLLIDKIFHLPTKQVALERCSPFLTIDNQCIFYGQFIQWALEEDLHYYIDHSTLGKVLQLAKESHQQSPALQYLCTVHLNSLMNEEFVHTYIEFAQAYPELCARIIFEINALHFSNLSFIARLQQLSMKGFNFALFSASLECPKELLSNVPFYYYIMDAHQLGFYLQKDSSLTVIQSIKHFLNQHHIEIIMVNINNEEKTVSIFLQFGISYGQGVFFSSPSFNHSLR
jgi:EAL domain-containing protein (putative c-di-GMP-specific phosphodiesterase class I)